MQRHTLDRRIREVHDRLVRVRSELSVADEQLRAVTDATEDARLRSLVSETPLAAREYAEAQRHFDVMARARAALAASAAELERRRDELLDHVGSGAR